MTSGFTFGPGAAQKTPGLSFGTTNTGMTFGTPATSSFSFGSFGTQPSGLSFGTPTTTSQSVLAFGTPAVSTPQAGLSFGTPASTAPQTGLSFGTPASTAQSGLPTFGASSFGQSSLGFGTPASTAPSGLTFGTPATTAATGQPTLGFGSQFGFGTSTTSTAFSVPTTSSGFGLGTFGGAATSAPSGFQGLGSLSTTASKPGGLFSTPATTSAGFGTLGATSTSLAGGFSLGGTGTSTGLFGLGGKSFPGATASTTATTTTAAASMGLGGIDPSQSKTGPGGTASGRPDNKAVKENQIPNEIVQTIESFKSFVKGQKNLSSDIARGSVKPLHKVQEDTELLKQMLSTISNGLQKNSTLAAKLKADTAKCLHHAEMAQRTHDTPPGLQYDNTAPLQYFQELVAGFEHEMQTLSQEIENTEKHIRSLMQPVPLTSQELALVMRRLHDSFVALAGRLQSVHNSVENQKEQYLNLRKYYLKDTTNVFQEEAKKMAAGSLKPKTLKTSAGPTPFSELGGQHGFGLISPSSSVTKIPFTSSNPLGWNCGQVQQHQPQQQQSQFLSSSISNPMFTGGSSNLNSLTPQPVESQAFQLQKPPLGNKRGKR